MPDILHRVGIRATPDEVFEALATVEGLAHWWATDTSGDPRPGGILRFRFGGGGFDMEVLESKLGERVKWRCVDGPPEWMGTELTFQLRPAEDQVFLLFTHAGWKEPVEFMHHCSTKWAVFLLGLRDWLERGEGRPTPYDVKIHFRD